ncbi:MAG: Dam family site-specific DNA-(adenine-N6)-methyltransferase [Synergistaceae bacterium]|nr:Dam family site-specific DNA-(adenine-N6)-methyltransferase [Synergistaceae bacterium]
MSEKIFVPPIKIQGIKTKLVPLIKQNISLSKNTLWLEPFMGSGVVGFNVRPERAVFADINPHIINFYNAIKTGKITSDIVRVFLYEQGRTLAQDGENFYYYVRERFNNYHEPLDFLFLNRSCFNGMIRFNREYNFNVPYGHKPQRFSRAYITKIINQVKYIEDCLRVYDWEFICQPFETTLAITETQEDTFTYCDPPYIGRHVDYYDSWDECSEEKLRCLLYEAQNKFMLSTWCSNQYRENKYINTIWSFCRKIKHEHFYHVGAKEINRHPVIEALLVNY